MLGSDVAIVMCLVPWLSCTSFLEYEISWIGDDNQAIFAAEQSSWLSDAQIIKQWSVSRSTFIRMRTGTYKFFHFHIFLSASLWEAHIYRCEQSLRSDIYMATLENFKDQGPLLKGRTVKWLPCQAQAFNPQPCRHWDRFLTSSTSHCRCKQYY